MAGVYAGGAAKVVVCDTHGNGGDFRIHARTARRIVQSAAEVGAACGGRPP